MSTRGFLVDGTYKSGLNDETKYPSATWQQYLVIRNINMKSCMD